MKRFFVHLLLMLLTSLVSYASPSLYYDGLYFEYSPECDQLSVQGDFLSPENHYSGNIVIPKEVPTEMGILPVTTIAEKAFYKSNITSIIIPESIAFISDDAFGECSRLTKIIFGDGLLSIGYRAFRGCPLLEEVILPESVKIIENQAFEDCISLKTVNLPSFINEISYDLPGLGQSCFKNCTKLVDIKLPDGMLSITESLFENCISLKKIEIPNSVGYIKWRAFYNSGIEEIVIPGSVQRIYWEAFLECKNLNTVIIEEGESVGQYSDLNLISDWGCDYFFDDSIKKLYVGKGLVTDRYELACPFKGLSNVTDFELGSKVHTIEEHQFEGMTSLQKLVIPAEIEYIRGYAFDGFGEGGSKSIECMGLKGASLTPSAFSDACYSQCELIVPQGAEYFYKNAFGWENFMRQTTDLISIIEDNMSIVVEGLNIRVSSPYPVKAAIYMLDGTLISDSDNGYLVAPTHGVFILIVKTGVKEKITKIYL